MYSEIVAKRYRHLLDADGQQFLGFLTEGGGVWLRSSTICWPTPERAW